MNIFFFLTQSHYATQTGLQLLAIFLPGSLNAGLTQAQHQRWPHIHINKPGKKKITMQLKTFPHSISDLANHIAKPVISVQRLGEQSHAFKNSDSSSSEDTN